MTANQINRPKNAHFIERLDIHGRTVWLPPLVGATAATLKAKLSAVVGKEPDWDRAAEILDIYGFMMIAKINHHGPQDYREWSLWPRGRTWAARECA